MREWVPTAIEDLPDSYDAEALGGQPLVEVKEADKLIDLSYRFPGFFRNDQTHDVRGRRIKFDLLEIGGLGRIMASGKPELPSFGRYVQIPPGTEPKIAVEIPGRAVEIHDVMVFPAQEKLMDQPAAHEFEFDESFYARDEFYPKDLATVMGPIVVDGYAALIVHVCPFQYNPKRKLLRAYPQVNVKISLTARPGAPLPQPENIESREAYGNLFLNPQRDVGPRLGFPAGPLQPLRPTGPQLLIVHAPKFAAAAKALARWKDRRGLAAALLEFQGTAADLKREIRARRASLLSRLRYVLLFGDGNDLPYETFGGKDTDYYYSTREDASAAVPLPMPWLALGRIPVRDTTEAMAVVNQIINYEQKPPSDPAYYHRFVCAAHFEAPGGHDGRDYVYTMEQIRAFLTSMGYDAERVYTCDTTARPLYYKNGELVPPDVVAAIMDPATATQRIVDATTEGHAIIGHRDHGDLSGWYMPPFKLADLDRVMGNVPSIFYSVNCLTGSWQTTTTTECFAEKNLRLPGTAPTLIAATEVSNTVLNNAMMLGLFDATFSGLLTTYPGSTVSYPVLFNRLGDVLNYSRFYLPLTWSGSVGAILDHCMIYHVVGDPSLEVWTEKPRALDVKARLVRHALEVEITPLPAHCTVTIWQGDTLLKSFTPSSHRFSIPIPALPPALPSRSRVLDICAWAHGYHFAATRATIPVVTPVFAGAGV